MWRLDFIFRVTVTGFTVQTWHLVLLFLFLLTFSSLRYLLSRLLIITHVQGVFTSNILLDWILSVSHKNNGSKKLKDGCIIRSEMTKQWELQHVRRCQYWPQQEGTKVSGPYPLHHVPVAFFCLYWEDSPSSGHITHLVLQSCMDHVLILLQ